MNKKIIYSMLIVLGVLLVFWFVLKNVGGPTSEPESLMALDIEFDVDKAARIDVYKQDYPDSGLHFARIDTNWVVTNAYNAPAKESDIQTLLTDLNEVSGQIRAESPELYDNFEIADEQALQIEIFDEEGSKLVHVYVGKGGSGRESFLRLAGSPTVYLADNNFISRFAAWNAPPEKKLPTSRWVELALCDIPREEIKSFVIDRGKTEYVFALVEETADDTLAPSVEVWTQVAPKKGIRLEESKIKRLHSTVASLRAADVADPEKAVDSGLDDPGYSVQVTGAEGNSVEVRFSRPYNEEDRRYAVVEGRNAVYTVTKQIFQRIFEDPFKEPDN